MPDKTEFRELKKNRVYQLKIGGIEISAMKLEGYKATQLGGTISPIEISAGGSKVEGDDWLIIVKGRNNIVMPYEVWSKQVAQEISKISGSNVNTVSVVTSVPYIHVTFRRGKNKDAWHWCTNCSNYPNNPDDVTVTKAGKERPSYGELCNECRAKEKAGTCKT